MRKSAKRKILILSIMFIGIIFAVKSYKSRGPSKTKVVATKRPKPRTLSRKFNSEIMVAARDIAPGTLISNADIVWRIPEGSAPNGVVKKIRSSEVLDKMRVTYLIREGDFVEMKYLKASPKNWDSVTPGMAIHSFKINANKGTGALLKPNMYVRVLYVENDKAVVVIEHARIIEVKVHTPFYPNRSNVLRKKEMANKLEISEEEHSLIYTDPNDLVDDDVYIEVTPQMAQMLSIEHGGHYILIPIKYHPRIYTPPGPYSIGDIGRTFMPINSKDGDRVIRTIKGDSISFQNLHGGVVPRDSLTKKPMEPPYPVFPDEKPKLRPPYRAHD